MKEEIRKFLESYDVNIVGFGAVPRGLEILEVSETFPRVVVFGYALSKSVLDSITDRPTLIYKHHYKTVNWLLDQTSYHLANYISTKGFRALALPASQLVDWTGHKGHASHRRLGLECGLGFIGLSGLLLHPQYGAQVRYTSVLTDAPFAPDPRMTGDCGNCRKCIDACPAKAITEKGVDVDLCYAQLSKFASIRGIGQHICGICVKVCDGNR